MVSLGLHFVDLIHRVHSKHANSGGPHAGRYARDFKEAFTIGHGAQGSVYLAWHKGKMYAVKKVALRHGLNIDAHREIDGAVSMSGGHPGIVKVFNWWEEGNALYIQMEYCDRGSLKEWLAHRDSTDVTEAFRQVVEGVEYMHRHGLLHRDIKPENIFISSTGGWKLGDFGVSKFREGLQSRHTGWMGTPAYMAPEVKAGGPPPQPHAKRHIRHSVRYGTPCDIYSLGVVLTELLSTQEECKDKRRVLIEGAKEGKFLHKHSELEIDLLKKMLSKDPLKRPTAEQILKHPLFSKVQE